MSLPEGAGVPDGDADVAAAAGGTGEDEVDAAEEAAGKCDLLVRDHYGAELFVQFVFDDLIWVYALTAFPRACYDGEIQFGNMSKSVCNISTVHKDRRRSVDRVERTLPCFI